MSGFDTLSMALKNLYKRKLRTFLTVLGVVVGACAIIIMISLGIAINTGFEQRMMTTPNATRLNIYNGQVYYGNDRFGTVLDDAMFERILQIPGVEAVTPWEYLWSMKSTIGRYVADMDIIGVYPEALAAMGFELLSGRHLTSEDTWGILFGANVPLNYKTPRERADYRVRWSWGEYDSEVKARVDVLKDRIKLSVDYNYGEESSTGVEDGYEDEVPPDDESTAKVVKPHNVYGVGIMAPSESYESTYYSFMNVSTVHELNKERDKWYQSMYGRNYNNQTTYGYNEGYVKVKDVAAIDGVIVELEKLGFKENENIYSSTSYIKDLKDTMSSLQTLLGAMGVISLFIATIGISNTMIMSTVERTREIGVMKVIGAALSDIRKLFLLESAIIGFFGGALGVGVSYVVSYFLNKNGLAFFKFVDMYNYYGQETTTVSIIPPWLSLASLGFAALIGLVAGFLPAQRATRLSALAAIRTD